MLNQLLERKVKDVDIWRVLLADVELSVVGLLVSECIIQLIKMLYSFPLAIESDYGLGIV